MKTSIGNRNPYNILHVVFCFWRDHNGNKAALLFCVIPAISPYIEYIKIRVENSHLLIYVDYKTFANANLCKFLS